MAITHVNGVIGADGSATGATSGTAPSFTASAGNLVCGGVTFSNATNVLTSVKIGSLIATLGTAINNTNNATFLVPYHFPGSILTGGAAVITAAFSAAVTYIRIIGDEFAGVQVSSPLDQATGQYQPAPSGGPSSGNVTPLHNGELIYGIVDDGSQGGGTWTAGSGFTLLEQNASGNAVTMASEWRVQATAAAIAATFTESFGNTTDSFETAIMTFQAAASSASSRGCIKGSILLFGCGIWAAKKIEKNEIVTRRSLILPGRRGLIDHNGGPSR
jgi:hypothetical protein